MTETMSIPCNAVTWNIDWKFALASGVAVFMVIMAIKTDAKKAGGSIRRYCWCLYECGRGNRKC